MKKITLLLLAGILAVGIGYAQESPESDDFKPSGEAFGKVFWNYHYDLNEDQNSAFELQRAYLGYKHKFSKTISTKITIDAARYGDASPFTAVLKHAQLDWQVSQPLKLSVGLIGLNQFSDQEKWWGYRYIIKSFQDEFALGSSADLGVNAEIRANDKLRFNLFMINGEGYTRLQDDFGMHKFGGNIIVEPMNGVILKAYYSASPKKYDKYGDGEVIADTSTIQNLAFFGGYEIAGFRIGAEYNLMMNGTRYYVPAEDHNLGGVAVYTAYVFSEKFEIFADYFRLVSNKLEGADERWNYGQDGNLILFGAQYSPVKGVKMALNYRTYIADNPDVDMASRIYMNFEFAF